jgi:hypothetical protein
MALMLGPPHHVAREVLADEHPAARRVIERRHGDPEARLALALGQVDRARELDRIARREARPEHFRIGALGVGGLQRDCREALARAREVGVVLARRVRRALRAPEQLDVIVPEHDAVILRAEGVVAARRHGEAHAPERVASGVKIAHDDHDVIDAFDVLSHREESLGG